jgi:hypothetical protein
VTFVTQPESEEATVMPDPTLNRPEWDASDRPQARRDAAARAGAVAAFPRGAAGAHRVGNPGEATGRVLIVSRMNLPEVGEYPMRAP